MILQYRIANIRAISLKVAQYGWAARSSLRIRRVVRGGGGGGGGQRGKYGGVISRPNATAVTLDGEENHAIHLRPSSYGHQS